MSLAMTMTPKIFGKTGRFLKPALEKSAQCANSTTMAITSSTPNGEAVNFRFIMDNTDDEQTYQYYTIKNEDDQLIGIEDGILNLPSVDNKQILYLTFDGNEDPLRGESSEIIGDVLQETTSEPSYDTSDMKLITLEDGTMFMTTDHNIGTNSIIMEDKNEAVLETHITNEEEEEDYNNSDTTYQLIQLPDGSRAVLSIFKVQEESPKEERPKKDKKFHCPYEGCSKVYVSSYHLNVHQRIHTDSKPFGCKMAGCEKRFSTNYSLTAHMRTHTGEKPYGCTICEKQFKTSGDLQKHIRIHTGEKPFLCPIEGCGRCFTTSNIRKVHVRSHTGERPYVCGHENCGKAFTSSTNYKNHLRIHSGEKPYVCPVERCGKRFTEYSSLYKHNSVHQPMRPYQCVFCGQKFKQEHGLNLHKRLKHDVVVTRDGTEIIVKIE